MKKILLALVVLLMGSQIAMADEYVSGYYRKDGTHVDGYYRSDANDTKYDNYSTKGNINPYTGAEGTKNPDNDGVSDYGRIPGSYYSGLGRINKR